MLPTPPPAETFTVAFVLLDPDGKVLFIGGPIDYTLSEEGDPSPLEVPAVYVGPMGTVHGSVSVAETGLDGVTVSLVGDISLSVTTARGGLFTFADVWAGTYNVAVSDFPPEFEFISPLGATVASAGHVVAVYFVGTVAPVLVLSQEGLSFSAVEGGSNPSTQTLDVSNGGAGTLNWSVSEAEPWLSLSPTSGSATTETDGVAVSVDITGLEDGTYTATITAVGEAPANDSPQTTEVTLTVGPPPVLVRSPASISFSAVEGGSNPSTQTLDVSNGGAGTLDWTVSEAAPWLSLSPASGDATTETDNVAVSVDITGLVAGTYTATITAVAEAPATGTPQTTEVTLTVVAAPVLVRSPGTISFVAVEGGSNPSTRTLEISNGGGSTLSWSVSEPEPWLSLSPTSGNATTETDSVTLSVDITGLTANTYMATITAVGDPPATGTPQTTEVLLTVGPPFTISPADAEKLPGGTQQFTVNGGVAPFTWSVNGVEGGDVTFGTITTGGFYNAPSAVPDPSTFPVCAADATAASVCAQVTIQPIPTAGEDVVVFNDINIFDNTGMDLGVGNPNNHILVQNLVGFSSSGSRSSGTKVWWDIGRSSRCASFCNPATSTTMVSVIENAGFTIEEVRSESGTLTSIPADVKVIFLWNPLVAFTVAEINTLKQFAAEGGRIIFVGEYDGFYGAGIQIENQFLVDMGAEMVNIGEAVDCGYHDLPGTALRSHQVTTGMSAMRIACASVITPGPNDFAFLYDSTDTKVLAGVAKIDVTPLLPGAPAPSAQLRAGAPGLGEQASDDPTGAALADPARRR